MGKENSLFVRISLPSPSSPILRFLLLLNWNDPHTNSMWCGDYNLSFKGRIHTATSSVHLGDGTGTDRGIEFPGIEVRFRHQNGPHSPAGSSFRKEFVLLDTDPHAAREKVTSFRLRSF